MNYLPSLPQTHSTWQDVLRLSLALFFSQSLALAQWTPFHITDSVTSGGFQRSTGLQNVSDCGGVIFFAVQTAPFEYEPAVTTGTFESSRFVADLYPGGEGSNPGVFTRMGDWVYYAATDNVNGRELWRTHVTTLETNLVKNIRPGSFSSSPHDFGLVNGKLLFSAEADPTTTGDELWISDGTESGTVFLKDLLPGATGSNISGPDGRLFVSNGVAYFEARNSTGTAARQLWRSDGTAAGTFLLFTHPDGFDARLLSLTVYNGRVYFFVRDDSNGLNGWALWATNGTTAGTTRIKTPVSLNGGGGAPGSTAVANGLLFFRGAIAGAGYELWKSDGTEAGTSMVKDIQVGSNGSVPNNVVTYKNRVYFVADDGIRGNQIWSSDGTSSGTVMVHEIYNAARSGRPEPAGLTVFGDFLFFNMLKDGYGREWWTTDGINLSNGPAFDLNPGSRSGIDEDYVRLVVGSSFYFYGYAPSVLGEFWRLNPPTPTRIIGIMGNLSFGPVNVGSTAQKTITLRNTGISPLTISGITLPAGFSGNWSGTIAPGGTQDVNVTFTPTAAQTYNGTVTIASNSTSGTNTIACSGIGIAAEIACEEPAGIDRNNGSTILFGSLPRGFTSTPFKTIVIRNVGNAPLTITGINLTGPGAPDFSLVKPKVPLVIAPRRFTRLTAAFKPTSEGNKAAILQIESNDMDESQLTLQFTGSGIAPGMTFAAGQGINSALPSSITSLGQVLSITRLPAGVKYDPTLGRLTGRPTGAGAFTARVSVEGSNGEVISALMTVLVEPLPTWALGAFTAVINPPTTSDATLTGLGGCLTLTAISSGTYSGSLRVGARSFGFRGQIEGSTAAALGSNPLRSSTIIVTNTKDRTQDITLNFEFRPENHPTLPGLTGVLLFQGRTLPINPGWQHVWNAKTNPAFGNKDRTLNVAIDNTRATGPQGDGFATIKLTRAGLAGWFVTLADGRKVTGSFSSSPDGDVPFYGAIPYPDSGALYALLPTAPSGDFHRVSDSPQINGRWIKLPTSNPKTIDRLYRGGFDVSLAISGAEHRAPARGVLLFGNPTPPNSRSFTLTGAGITTSAELPGNDPVSLQAELRLGNAIGVPPQSGLPPNLHIAPSFHSASGLFSGRIALSDLAPPTSTAAPRTLSYSGLYIPNLASPSSSTVRGFFTLPELPDAMGETISNTPINSGALRLAP